MLGAQRQIFRVTTRSMSQHADRPSAMVDKFVRVDHAGELGADRIYAGQMAVLGKQFKCEVSTRVFNENLCLSGHTKVGPTIKHMWEQEVVHRTEMERLIKKHRVRPTIMTPFWNIAGFALGAGTAMMGEKAAMACTVAVETVIVEHYNDQLRQLMASGNPDKELLEVITKFRDEEQEHHDCGIEHGAKQAPFYEALTNVIKFGCKTAIKISEKI